MQSLLDQAMHLPPRSQKVFQTHPAPRCQLQEHPLLIEVTEARLEGILISGHKP